MKTWHGSGSRPMAHDQTADDMYIIAKSCVGGVSRFIAA